MLFTAGIHASGNASAGPIHAVAVHARRGKTLADSLTVDRHCSAFAVCRQSRRAGKSCTGCARAIRRDVNIATTGTPRAGIALTTFIRCTVRNLAFPNKLAASGTLVKWSTTPLEFIPLK